MKQLIKKRIKELEETLSKIDGEMTAATIQEITYRDTPTYNKIDLLKRLYNALYE